MSCYKNCPYTGEHCVHSLPICETYKNEYKPLTGFQCKIEVYSNDKIEKAKRNKITHGDKIRSMSDEELAVTIMCPAEYDLDFDKKKSCGGEMNNNCRKCCFEWLQSEVKEI